MYLNSVGFEEAGFPWRLVSKVQEHTEPVEGDWDNKNQREIEFAPKL